MEDKKTNIVLVGLFITIGSVLVFATIILFGQEKSLFESTTTIYAAFEDVGGLKTGSQVRLAGVGIGIVNGIAFPDELTDKRLHVEMEIQESYMIRIRKDSVATISTKGLLGDKVIEITIGSDSEEQIANNEYIETNEPPDIFSILEKGQYLINAGGEVADNLKVAIQKYSDDELVNHIKGITKSLDDLFAEVRDGDGVVHGLIYDAQVNADLRGIMRNIRQVSKDANQTMIYVNNMLDEVKNGDGVVHALIYEREGAKIVKHISKTAETIEELTLAIKNEEGMLHNLIYESDYGNIISNLDEATNDIKELAEFINQGHGTVGGLIRDPTVYEDLKTILGNLKRNAALKALIRMSIEQQESTDAQNRTPTGDLPESED